MFCRDTEIRFVGISTKKSTGQSHLIFGTGSTSCVITSQLSKLCCISVLYKALEILDAIALAPTAVLINFLICISWYLQIMMV